jgi:FkbM family methyltransferase
MKVVLKYIKKTFPKIYNNLAKSNFLYSLLEYINLLNFVTKHEGKLIWFFIKTTFSYYILKNHSDITFLFHGNEITLPRHLKWIDWFIEIYTEWFYDKIKWYNHVLDIWWYVGDSASKFAQDNKYVTCYEAHPENFKYLKYNTEKFDNISIYNQAVTWNKEVKELKFYGGAFNMWAWTWNFQNTEWWFTKVPAKSILDILSENKYDALKCDIEWAEFDCFDMITKNDSDFNFKCGFIEFHLWWKENLRLKTETILNWLKENRKYKIEYYDLNDRIISFNEALNKEAFFIYFYY